MIRKYVNELLEPILICILVQFSCFTAHVHPYLTQLPEIFEIKLKK